MKLYGTKAQSEILGLAFVMVLIAFGLIFIVTFIVLADDDSIRRDFVDKQLATNLNNAMLDTQTTCRDSQISRLIIDCASDQLLRCGSSSEFTSCQYLFNQSHSGGVIHTILNQTLEEYAYEYVYRVRVENIDGSQRTIQTITNLVRPVCPRGQIPSTFFFPAGFGTTVFVELFICE